MTVTIYHFEVYRIDSDEVVKSRRWGAREAISEIAHGRHPRIHEARLRSGR